MALVGRDSRGQTMAEFAIVLPVLTLLILACLQAGLLGYAALVAREAAFRGLRAAAVAEPAVRERAAREAVIVAVASAPGLTLAGFRVREAAGNFPERAQAARRMELSVRVGAPRLVPARAAWVAEGRAVMPMEPPRETR